MKWRPVRLRRQPEGPARRHVACNAPFSSMFLDQRGWVRACCMNDFHTLGNITEQSLTEIWHGDRARELRRAMERDDLTLGCEFCKWQVDEGRAAIAYSRWFRDLATDESDPQWPRQLEFSISNTCNLQCAMCNGEWSSSIRSQREGLEPLPKVYGDDFFEDLAGMLPHLERIKFLGGEPFLASETLRIMDMIVEQGLHPRCHVTTNGTQWSPRVERILEMVPIDVAVSLDAATAETYESIRIGSSWETVQRNLDRFQEWGRRRDIDVTVTFCLMTVNHHEFMAFCRNADERGINCAVNTVSQPDHMSLFRLPPEELEVVVAGLEEQDRAHGGELTLSAETWRAELEKLRAHLDDRRAGRSVVGVDVRSMDELTPRPFARSDELRTAAEGALATATIEQIRADRLPAGAARLRLDATGMITEVVTDGAVLGLPSSKVVGHSLDEVTEMVADEFGVALHSVTAVDSEVARVIDVAYPGGRKMVVITAPATDESGEPSGLWLDVGWL